MSTPETVIDQDAALELAHSALINFDNAARMPIIKQNPFFAIARIQLVDAIKNLGRDLSSPTD